MSEFKLGRTDEGFDTHERSLPFVRAVEARLKQMDVGDSITLGLQKRKDSPDQPTINLADYISFPQPFVLSMSPENLEIIRELTGWQCSQLGDSTVRCYKKGDESSTAMGGMRAISGDQVRFDFQGWAFSLSFP